MFINFDNVFSKKPQSEMKIPDALVELLSSKFELPDGLKYDQVEGTNILFITSKTDKLSFRIDDMSPVLTLEQKEILGDNFSINDVFYLSYNSQKDITFTLKNTNTINVNGNNIPIENFILSPFANLNIKDSTICLSPPPFPPAFSISIGCDDVSNDLSVKQVPNNSIEVMAFESDKESCLFIQYYVNKNTNSFSLNINVSPSKAKTIKEIIDSINIYNAFVNGKGKLAGNSIEEKIESPNSHIYDSDILGIWLKIYEIENKLNITFNPPFNEFDFDDICLIEELYQNLINKTPIKRNVAITSITSQWEFNKDKTVEESLNKPVYFESIGMDTFELFGIELNLPCLIGIYNAVISDYKKNGDECTIFLSNESEDKKINTSILRFINDSELSEYKSNVSNRMKIFIEAKKSHEYFSD